MKRILTLIMIAFLGLSFNASSQGLPIDLGQINADIEISSGAETVAKDRAKGITKQAVSTLPVVVHIVHKGTPINTDLRYVEQPMSENINDLQVKSAIDNLNDRFANTWVPYWQTPEVTNPGLARSVNARIGFAFAQRTPEGNPTNGINRYSIYDIPGLTQEQRQAYADHGISTDAMFEGLDLDVIKEQLAWNPTRYINIYVVTEFNDNDAGCGEMIEATFPSTDLINSNLDGIAIQFNKFGYGAYSTLTRGLNLQLTEAMGTYLGLYPVYQGIVSCEDALDEIAAEAEDPLYCQNNGDRVCDTGPTMYICSSLCLEDQFCDETIDMPSGWLSTYDNYMNTGMSDFCRVRFTQGQIDRMESTVNSLRSDLVDPSNLALVQPNEDGMAVELSVRRTCANEYSPTIFITNTGYQNILGADYEVLLKKDGTTIYTMPGTLIGDISVDAQVRVPFPIMLIEDLRSYTISAEANFLNGGTQRVDGYLTDNTSTYALNKVSDGYVNFNMQYRANDGGANIVIKKINGDGTEEVVMDGNKTFNSMTYQHNNNWRADNTQLSTYFRYGGSLAEALGIRGQVAPWGTVWIGDTGYDTETYHTLSSTYYIEPGDYAVELNANIFYMNEERWYSIFGDCSDGENGENCFISINELGSLINSTVQQYYETSDATFTEALDQGNSYPFVFEPLDPSNPGGTLFDDDGLNAGGVGSQSKRFEFTVVEDSNASSIPCCVDANMDGFCDGYDLNNEDAEIALSNRYPSPDRVILELVMTKQGLGVIEDVTFQIATDLEFSNLVMDYDTTFSNINQEYFLTDRGQHVIKDGLTPQTTYYARAIIDDRAKAVYSNTIQFTTPQDACANYGNGSGILTYDGKDYDLVSVYNMCWLKQGLFTKRTVGGTNIEDGSQLVDWAQNAQAGNPVWTLDPSRTEQEQWEDGVGLYYNYAAKELDDICPTGFHVSSWNDWMSLDTLLGAGKSIRRMTAVDQGGYNYFGLDFRTHGWFEPRWDGSLDANSITAQDITWVGSTPYSFTGTPNSPSRGGKFWILNDDYYDETSDDTGLPRSNYIEALRLRAGGAQGWSKVYLTSRLNYQSGVTYQGELAYQTGMTIRCVAGGNPDPVEVLGQCGATFAVIPNYPGGSPGSVTTTTSCNYNPQSTQHNKQLCYTRDECGTCGGNGVQEGACDCDGNVEDALGVCGGPCSSDENADGVCDDIASFVNGDASVCDFEVSKFFNGVNYSIAGFGGECWFLDNLKTEFYANGEQIQSANTKDLWVSAAQNELPVVDNRVNHDDLTSNQKSSYGNMYNWYAQNDSRNVCPNGWHPATDRDWRALETSIGIEADIVNRSITARGENTFAGAILRGGALEFNAYPGGIRTQDGNLRGVGLQSWMWSSSPWNTIRGQYRDNAYHRAIGQSGISDGISRYSHSFGTAGSKGHGMSVRCVKNSPTSPGN